MKYYNIHSHVFTMKNAPEKFLHLYLPGPVANLIDTLTNTQAGANSVSWLLSKLPGEGAKRYASFLHIGKSADQIDVYRILRNQYPTNEFKFMGLALYMEDVGELGSQSGYEGQLEGLMDIKRNYPDEFLIFLGVDPRWKGSARELRRTVESKFNYRLSVSASRSVFPYVGLKIYPSTGFYAFDEKLTETFEWAADNGVPILSHCNYLGGIYNNDKKFLQSSLNPIDPYTQQTYSQPKYYQQFKLGSWLTGTNAARNNQFTCSYFLEPSSFASLTHHFHTQRQLSQPYKDPWFDAYRKAIGKAADTTRNPLKICLAHYGGDDQILMDNNQVKASPPLGVDPTNWCGQIKQLMTEFEGIYTDISYALFNRDIHPFIIKKDLEDPILGDRILFGTDFFLTERKLPEKDNYSRFRADAAAHSMTRVPGSTAWDVIASRNPARFLFSKYFDGTVL